MNGQPKKTSPWVWVGVGCLGALVLAVGAVLAVGFFGYRKAKEFEAELRDPQARAEKVRSILGAEHLPEGYHAVIGMSVPLVMDMALLSDEEPDFDHGRGSDRLGRRGFLYFRTLAVGGNRQELRDYFEGRTDDVEILRRNRIRLDRRGQVLSRGTLDLEGGLKVLYLSQRGELDMGSSRAQGVNTVMLLECQGDTRQRFGIWFGPEPPALASEDDSDAEVAPADLSGTPADEGAMREFLDHFHLCRE